MVFFSSSRKRLRKRAAEVVPLCGILAAGLSTPMGRTFPELLSVPLPIWNRALTVAGVCHAITLLKSFDIARSFHEELVGLIVQHLQAEDASAVEALMVFTDGVNSELSRLKSIPEIAQDPQLLRDTAFGVAVTLELLGRLPLGPDGGDLIAAIGQAVCEQTADIWNA